MSAPSDMTPDQALAMDYALGALDREARRSLEARMRSEPALRAQVEHWQALISPLAEDTTPVLPPASVWAAVKAEIEPPVRRAAAPASTPPAPAGWWHNLALWRGLGLGGPALAAAAVFMLNPSAPPPPASTNVAQLASAEGLLATTMVDATGQPLLAATWDPLRESVVLTPATPRDDPGKVAELWVIEGERPPRSLGLIGLAGPEAHAISSQVVSGLKPGAILAISIEPIGGSPTGLPTGPVIATGKLSAI